VETEILDVHIAAEAGVEKQVPAGMVIVVVDVYAIAVPFPIAAAIQVVGGNYPVRIVVEHHATRSEVDPPGDKYFAYVLVVAIRIRPPWPNTVVLGIPIGVGVVRIVPAFVVSVVMAIAAILSMFVFAFMLPVVVVRPALEVVERWPAFLPRP
jgi:hypothetical protein